MLRDGYFVKSAEIEPSTRSSFAPGSRCDDSAEELPISGKRLLGLDIATTGGGERQLSSNPDACICGDFEANRFAIAEISSRGSRPPVCIASSTDGLCTTGIGLLNERA